MPVDEGVPAELLALAARAAAPQLTEIALARRFGPRSGWEPTRGQIWRAVHEDITLLVLCLEIESAAVRAAPVTLGESPEQAGILMLDPSQTKLGVPAAVWVGLVRSVPLNVLDRPVDVIDDEVIVRVLGLLRRGAATAATPTSLADISAGDRAALADDLAALVGVGAAAQPTHPEPDVAGGVGVNDPAAFNELVARLGISLPAALELIDGKRIPSTQERAALQDVLGGVPAPVPPPPGLLLEFSRPKWRGLVRQRGQRHNLTDGQARLDLAYEVGAMAARQTGDQEPDWSERIRRWADAHRLDPDVDG